MKKFLVVLSMGMAALALVAVLSRSGLERESEPARTSVSPTTAVNGLDVALEPPGPPATQAPPPVIASPEPMDVTSPVHHVREAALHTAAIEQNPRERAAMLTEDEARALCKKVFDRQIKEEQAVRASEPKDSSWAYPMEQKLRQFLASRTESLHFEVTTLDCKTISCELTVQGSSPDAHKAFEEVLSAATKQPWNDFTGIETQRMDDGSELQHARLTRRGKAQTHRSLERRTPRSGEEMEERICDEWNRLALQRRQAARDAEPKDSSWAYSMEQLLRQHITSELGRHRVERFDIDCRTTYCVLQASGTSEDARAAFQRISQAVWQEPWSDFRTGEVSGTGYGDSWKQEVVLLRQSGAISAPR